MSGIEEMMEKTKQRRKELVSKAGSSFASIVDAVPHPFIEKRPFLREPIIKMLLRRRRE